MKFSDLTSAPIFERITPVDKLQLTKNLSVLLKSGIPLGEAFDVISRQSKKLTLKKVTETIKLSIANGLPLNVSLAKYPSIFDPLYINLVRIGEESGNLEKNLDYIYIHQKKSYDFHKKVRDALIYPEVILTLTFIVSAGLSLFVLPKLIDLFESLDVQLPLSTRMLLAVAGIMKNYGIFIFSGLILLFFLFKQFIKLPGIRSYWHKFLFQLPIFGIFLQKIEMSSFTRNIGIMLESGLPISAALKVQHEVTANTVFKNYISKILDGVEKGSQIESTLEKYSSFFQYFPLLAVKMIGVGERTGKLDESLLYLSEFFDEEIDETSKNFSSLLDPVILIVVGIVVGFLAISIIAPIYEFTGNIKG